MVAVTLAKARKHDISAEVHLCAGFSDAGNDGAIDALMRPASEKRQGTKSRKVAHRGCSGRYGDLAWA